MRQEILDKINGNQNLLKVNLANMKINDDEISEIVETIKQIKPTMTKIDLDNNKLSDRGAQILSEQLRNFNKISEISLQFNNVGKEGALELFSLKKVFPELNILFRGNQIVDQGEMDDIERLAVAEGPNP